MERKELYAAAARTGDKLLLDCGNRGLIELSSNPIQTGEMYCKYFKVTIEEISKEEILVAQDEGRR